MNTTPAVMDGWMDGFRIQLPAGSDSGGGTWVESGLTGRPQSRQF